VALGGGYIATIVSDVDDDVRATIVDDVRNDLAAFVSSGSLAFPIASHLLLAHA